MTEEYLIGEREEPEAEVLHSKNEIQQDQQTCLVKMASVLSKI